MRTESKAKFLHHLNNHRNSERGFTLVELLVVIIIIGILSAIALPNFLNQSAKAKQSEAKVNIGAFNRLQITQRVENKTFTSTFDSLAIASLKGVQTYNTPNYKYDMTATTQNTTLQATALDPTLKSYSGGASQFINGSNNSANAGIVCEALTPGIAVLGLPNLPNNAAPTCTAGTQMGN
jgi:type IV pilus assembly protein PilA